MTAAIVPFPLAKRRTMIDRQARYAVELRPDAAERHIQQQLKVQGDSMRRRGIDEDLIACELKCMRAAISAALLRAYVSIGAQ
jgi:Family of unknown function (DUF6074)